MYSKLKGFTLLELLLVIAIISVLAGLVIFNLRPADILKSANDTKRKTDVTSIEKAIKTFITDSSGVTLPVGFNSLVSGKYDICKQGITNCTANSINLDDLVSSGIIQAIPLDPSCTSATDTCYDLTFNQTTTGIVVTAPLGIVVVPTPTPPVATPTPTPTPPVLAIGDNYQGGRVAYIDGTGIHGLIAATADQGIPLYWRCVDTVTPGADGTTIGTGHQNTHDMILAGCAHAAELVHTTINGYSDWYLPSKDELALLYANKNAIGGFTNSGYWSSTEHDAWMAWVIWFNSGVPIDNYKIDNTLRVRAVRTF